MTKENEDNSNIANIIIIGSVSVMGCLILSGLAYLYYYTKKNDSLPEFITNTFNNNFGAPSGFDEYGDYVFLGQNSAEYQHLNE